MPALPAPKFRPLEFGVTRVVVRSGEAGIQYLRAVQALGEFPTRITDRFQHWARIAPERSFIAQREKLPGNKTGEWQHITYAQAWQSARCIAQALICRGLSLDRPVAILSENNVQHALLSLGCMLAGVPFVPVSPAYSLVSQDFDKLRHVLRTTTPGLVFAADGVRYGKAILAAVASDVEVVLGTGQVEGRNTILLSDLLAVPPTPAVDAAIEATGPDTVVKFLFTSGSTRLPKAVINTQRLWCANQQQMAQSMPVLLGEPPVLVDWLPWSHTFGGNHNFGLVLFHGGTLYIDEGKPTPALIGQTLRNLREVAPTVYFNVPAGFQAIADAMKTDDVLRRNLLSRVQMFFYAGAALAQPIWDSLYASQEKEIGERIAMTTGLGMTESGPFGLFVTHPHAKAAHLGVPTPGLVLKLVPTGSKTEVRYKGPNITPGYWRAPLETSRAFDDEGFFCSGDAVKWIDENNIHLGLSFDGRIAEDFKLATGTFVSVGPLRAKIIALGAPYVQDVVLTGINMNEVGALVIPAATVRDLSGLRADTPMQQVLQTPEVAAHFQQLVNQLAHTSTGSASRIARLYVMHEPPSSDSGEVTDKGSVNQSAVLAHRSALVMAFHADAVQPIFKPETAQTGGNA